MRDCRDVEDGGIRREGYQTLFGHDMFLLDLVNVGGEGEVFGMSQ